MEDAGFPTEMRYLNAKYVGCPEAGRSLPEAGGARSDSEARIVKMRNARLLERPTMLDREGFKLLTLSHREHESIRRLGDPYVFLDQRPEDRAAYFRVFEKAVMKDTGAMYVQVINSVLRRSSIEGVHTLPSGDNSARGAVNDIHTDFCDDAPALQRLSGRVEQLGLNGVRWTVVNAWRSVAATDVVRQWPMAFCDVSSVQPQELVPRVSPENGNRIHNLLYSSEHRWFYYPHMSSDELLLFKQWDTDGARACFTPHTAFDAPRDPGMEHVPRESCELRLLCLFADEIGGQLSREHRAALCELHRQGSGLVAPELLGGVSRL
jgi:hypothetical protein